MSVVRFLVLKAFVWPVLLNLPIIYGGCDGNANSFDTLEECEFVCKEKDYWNAELSNSVSYVK